MRYARRGYGDGLLGAAMAAILLVGLAMAPLFTTAARATHVESVAVPQDGGVQAAFVPRRVPIFFIPNQGPDTVAPDPGYPDENYTGTNPNFRGPDAGEWLNGRIQAGIDRRMDVVFQLPHGKSSGLMAANERYVTPEYKRDLITKAVEPFVRAEYARTPGWRFGIYTGSHYSLLTTAPNTLPPANNASPRIYDLGRPNQMAVFLDNYQPWLFANFFIFDRGNSMPPNFQNNQTVLMDFNDRVAMDMGWLIAGESCTDGPQLLRMSWLATSDGVVSKGWLKPDGTLKPLPDGSNCYWLIRNDDDLRIWNKNWDDTKKAAQIKKMVDAGWVPAPMSDADADLVVRVCASHPKIKWN